MAPKAARPESAGGANRPGLDDLRVAAESEASLHLTSLRAQAARRLRRQRQVEWICRTPRLVDELLEEIARHYDLGDDIDQRLGKYTRLDSELLHALGGDKFAPLPLHVVGGAP
jgi:hypothetical protein